MSSLKVTGALEKLFGILVFLTLLVSPTQWALQVQKGMFVTLSDLLLCITAGVGVLKFLAGRVIGNGEAGASRRASLLNLLPPWPFLLFCGWCVIAMCGAFSPTGKPMLAVKETIQYVEYFVIGACVFQSYLNSSRAKWGIFALSLGVAVNVGLAIRQYVNLEIDDTLVRGSYGTAAAFGGILCLTLPFAASAFVFAKNWYSRVCGLFLFLCGIFVMLDGAAYWAVTGILFIFAAISVVTRVPAFARHDEYRPLNLPAESEERKAGRNPFLFFVAVACFIVACQAAVLPNLTRENERAHFTSLALFDEEYGEVNKRYAEWQAAYKMGYEHPWVGVGLGQYQTYIGQFYDAIPRQTGPSVPDSQNLYLVLFATAGFPGFFLFLSCLLLPFTPCRGNETGTELEFSSITRRVLSYGCAGAVAAFAFASIWHPLLMRGIGLPLVFILVLAYRLQPREGITNESE
ncbi:MAG: O-antigen ligase family protein [Kiritimatiellae bacterium]|nr:O-antigen ligase family protein [Kiritimatiellia bacterium]